MSRKSKGKLRLVVFLAVLVGAWYVVKIWWPRNNPQLFSGQLESAVRQELAHQGITDRDIQSQIHKEHGYSAFKWVESETTLLVRSSSQAQEISKGLEQVSHRLHCTFKQYGAPEGLQLQIKRFVWTLERITLTVNQAPKVAAPHGRVPQVAFVIDDVAYETVSMDRFASLGVPLTFAILPREKHSGQLARKANAMNFPVMLHLPMEPLDVVHNDPGPTGLYLKMSDAELKSQFEKNVASIPNLVGINNHMGSAFTESDPKMTLVLQWVKKRGLYFLDSRTSGKSVVCKVAKRLGVPCLANETFLDNKDDVKSIEDQLDLVMKLALKEGQTIAIGHYRRKFLVQALANKLPQFKAHGVQIVTLPTFYHR